jgi:hypothetical protein
MQKLEIRVNLRLVKNVVGGNVTGSNDLGQD